MADAAARSIDAAQIAHDLPSFPQQIIETWLLPHARRPDHGWPPSDGVSGPWQALLLGRPLGWWSGLRWTLEHHSLEAGNLHPVSRHALRAMVEKTDAGGDLPPRIGSCFAYLRETGRLPSPPVAVATPRGLLVADGYHRLCALRLAGRGDTASAHAVWIGWHEATDSQTGPDAA